MTLSDPLSCAKGWSFGYACDSRPPAYEHNGVHRAQHQRAIAGLCCRALQAPQGDMPGVTLSFLALFCNSLKSLIDTPSSLRCIFWRPPPQGQRTQASGRQTQLPEPWQPSPHQTAQHSSRLCTSTSPGFPGLLWLAWYHSNMHLPVHALSWPSDDAGAESAAPE